MLGRRGRAMPGSWGLAAIGKKSCRSSPHTTTSTFWGGLDFIFPWYAGQAGLCRAGAAGALVEPLGEPVLRGRWASQY